jgi:hypothetical protein
MGTLLALGLAAAAERIVWRALAAAATVPLMTAMYLTFSRGGWVALGVGLVALVAIAPRRLHLLAVLLAIAPWPALAVVAASRADALTTDGSTLAAATDDGRVLLVYVAVLTVAAGLAGGFFAIEERRVQVGRVGRTAFAALLVCAALVGAGWIWSEHGSPWSLAERGWDQFTASGGPGGGEDLSARLFDLSSNGRVDLWRVAWEDFEGRPVVGNGAQSFTESWYERRPTISVATDAHSLYLETLGELGLVGLALLVAALAVPVVGGVLARRDYLVAGPAGAYAAFLAHAGVDWDWELAGVTVVALLLGAALVVLARAPGRSDELRARIRLPAAAVGVVLAAVALWSLLATVPLGRARDALFRAAWPTAIEEAERAERWAPWSSEPFRISGEALLAQGRVAEARRSFARAIEKEDGDWLLWLQLGITTTGERQRAALARAIALNPNEQEIKIVLDAVRKQPQTR